MGNHAEINRKIKAFDPRTEYVDGALPQGSWIDLEFYGFVAHRYKPLMPFSVRRREKQVRYRSKGKTVLSPATSYWLRLSEAMDALQDTEGDGMTRTELRALAMKRLGIAKARHPGRVNKKIVFGTFLRFDVHPPWWRRVRLLQSPEQVIEVLAEFYGCADLRCVHEKAAPYFHAHPWELDFRACFQFPRVVLRYPEPPKQKTNVAG